MKRYVIRMGELAEPHKHPATFTVWRELLEWLRSKS
jgi:hypothetical protein